MALETMVILLVLVYVLATAVAYALTEPNRPRHVSEIPADEPRHPVSRRSRAISQKLAGFGAIVVGILAVAKGLLMLLAPETIAGMPGWVQTFAGVGRPITDLLPAFLYLGLGWWIIGAGVATMAERKRRHRPTLRRDAKTPRPGVTPG